MSTDLLVVGAGICGASAARVAAELGQRVVVIDKQPHVAGHIHDGLHSSGIMLQTYGPHIFHTEKPAVWDFLSRFTRWNGYRHRVLSRVRNRFVPFPISMATLEALYDRPFDEASMKAFIDHRKLPLKEINNSRDLVQSQVGEELYELFVKHYTRKQWGLWAEELDPSVLRRVPLRFNRNPEYFTDPFQGIPLQGFTALIGRMLDHPHIQLHLSTPYEKAKTTIPARRTLYTGRLDEFYAYRYGVLPYRSLRFRLLELDRQRVFPAGVVNFPGKEPFTRVSEYKTLYRQEDIPKTLLAVETPMAEGEPFYPIPGLKNRELVERYRRLAAGEKDIVFAGRLGGYRYLNMDQAAEEGMEWGEAIARQLRSLVTGN